MLLNKNNSVLLAAVVSSSLSSFSALAEDIPTVVVSAARSHQSTVTIPSNIKVISREQIEASGAINFTEVISSVGGVHVTDLFGDGSQGVLSMRGFGATAISNVLVIVDGRRINNIDLSGPDLNSISVKDIEQVEIIQSSAGVLYGDQAVGGVINVVTRKPAGFVVDAKVQTGSYGRSRFQARVSDRLSDSISYMVSSDFLRSENYRDNNDLDNKNLLGHVDYEYSTGNVFVEYQRVIRDQQLPGALFSNEVEEDRQQSTVNFTGDFLSSETEVARIGTKTALNEQWFLEAELATRQFDYASRQGYSGGPATSTFVIESEQFEFTPRVIGMLPFNGGEAIVTTGVDYLNADYKSFLEDEQTSLAYYMQAVLPVADNTALTLGGRKGRVENDMTSFYVTDEISDRFTAYEFGLQSKLNDRLTVHIRYDESFRFAKVDELSFTTPGVPLRAQTGKSKELGIEWSEKNYALKVQLYRLDLIDEISYDPFAPGPYTGSGANVNLDPTTHDGLIVEADYTLNKQVDMSAAFTYSDATFDSGLFADNKIPGVAERKVSFITRYKPTRNVKTYLEALYTDDHYMSGDNANDSEKLDSYAVVNVNISYQIDELELSVRVNNLLDKEYSSSANDSFPSASFFPLPDRNFWLSAAVRFE